MSIIESIFHTILNMCLTAGILVAIILIFRPLLKSAPATLRCLLWAVVAVRLILPVTLPLPIGLFGQDGLIGSRRVAIEDYNTVQQVPTGPDRSYMSMAPGNLVYTVEVPFVNTGIGALDENINERLAARFSEDTAPGDSADPIQVTRAVLTGVWLAGIAVMALYGAISYFKVRKSVRIAAETEPGSRIFIADGITTPFILGVFKPLIYVPSGISAENLQAVIGHEETHLLRHDNLWKPLGYVLLSIYWFNPLLWVAYILLCQDIELACDERVTAGLDEAGRAAYSQALLDCSAGRFAVSACPLAFGEVAVKERIKKVLNYRKPTLWIIIAGIVLCAVLVVCAVTVRKPEENPGTNMSLKDYKIAVYISKFPSYRITVKLLEDDADRGNTLSPGLEASLKGDDMDVDSAREKIEKLQAEHNITDNQVVLVQYQNPLSSYLWFSDENTGNEMAALFDNRYDVLYNVNNIATLDGNPDLNVLDGVSHINIAFPRNVLKETKEAYLTGEDEPDVIVSGTKIDGDSVVCCGPLVFTKANGRYLQLQLPFETDETGTPVIDYEYEIGEENSIEFTLSAGKVKSHIELQNLFAQTMEAARTCKEEGKDTGSTAVSSFNIYRIRNANTGTETAFIRLYFTILGREWGQTFYTDVTWNGERFECTDFCLHAF